MEEKKDKKELEEQFKLIELEMLGKGVRPPWMKHKEFKVKRKALQRMEKHHKRGRMIHVSKEFVKETEEVTDEKTGKVTKKDVIKEKGLGTYRRTTPKRHEMKKGTLLDNSK